MIFRLTIMQFLWHKVNYLFKSIFIQLFEVFLEFRALQITDITQSRKQKSVSMWFGDLIEKHFALVDFQFFRYFNIEPIQVFWPIWSLHRV